MISVKIWIISEERIMQIFVEQKRLPEAEAMCYTQNVEKSDEDERITKRGSLLVFVKIPEVVSFLTKSNNFS